MRKGAMQRVNKIPSAQAQKLLAAAYRMPRMLGGHFGWSARGSRKALNNPIDLQMDLKVRQC